MAGAEKLIEKILSDAQHDAETTWADVEAKKQAIRDKALRDIERRKAEIEQRASESITENQKRLTAVYDLEYRKQILAAKQEMMQKARGLALERMRSLDDASYIALMKRRLIECATSGTGAIAIAPNDSRLDAAFLADVNTALKKTVGRGEVTLLPERRNIDGGFVYLNGGMEIDVSLEALLSEAWQQAETQVAAALFK